MSLVEEIRSRSHSLASLMRAVLFSDEFEMKYKDFVQDEISSRQKKFKKPYPQESFQVVDFTCFLL